MSNTWKLYAIRGAVRCVTFYLAIAAVQYLFDGRVMWLANIIPAVGFAVFLTYVQARLRYIRELQAKRKK